MKYPGMRTLRQFHSVFDAQSHQFKAQFGVNGDGFDDSKEVACIYRDYRPHWKVRIWGYPSNN
jgi:hypothetical protein